jgi:predicted Zn-dependent protease
VSGVSRQWVILGVACVALTACNAPSTARPMYDRAEVQMEASEQAKVAKLVPKNFNEKKNYSSKQILEFAARLDYVASKIEPAAAHLCQELFRGQQNCNYQIVFAPKEKGINAHADGKDVVVYPALIDFARNDNHLAFVIAHEFAHNIMRHVASQQQNVMGGTILGTLLDVAAASQGYDTGGQLGSIGAQAALLSYSQDFEQEADYVGLYILARAGFNLDDAPHFWRAMSTANPDSIYSSVTHPSNPERFVSMQKTIGEIRQKEKAKQALIPNFMTKS